MPLCNPRESAVTCVQAAVVTQSFLEHWFPNLVAKGKLCTIYETFCKPIIIKKKKVLKIITERSTSLKPLSPWQISIKRNHCSYVF